MVESLIIRREKDKSQASQVLFTRLQSRLPIGLLPNRL